MRLPQPLQSSHLFQFENTDQLIAAIGAHARPKDPANIQSLAEKGLPPIVSEDALSTLIGINPGLVWSFVNRPGRHYRQFTIPKGHDVRHITAPRVALKAVQTWLSVHLASYYQAPDHVYGFVSGRSHISAAMIHRNAEWAYSADIANFFSSTPFLTVMRAFESLGYDAEASRLCARLCCFQGSLAQGAPTSPTLSNICFAEVDARLQQLAQQFESNITRYADDIVFSGTGVFNIDLREQLSALFQTTPWTLAPQKELLQPVKGRIKIHGLLVGQGQAKLTKGYRNQMRAYGHILATKEGVIENHARLHGHVQYARLVKRMAGTGTGISEATDLAIKIRHEKMRRLKLENKQPLHDRLLSAAKRWFASL